MGMRKISVLALPLSSNQLGQHLVCRCCALAVFERLFTDNHFNDVSVEKRTTWSDKTVRGGHASLYTEIIAQHNESLSPFPYQVFLIRVQNFSILILDMERKLQKGASINYVTR